MAKKTRLYLVSCKSSIYTMIIRAGSPKEARQVAYKYIGKVLFKEDADPWNDSLMTHCTHLKSQGKPSVLFDEGGYYEPDDYECDSGPITLNH